ncbi:hypothetical protein BGW42_005348 [Actinomortierella wolfii]|nr:hypothetical protein BGW42_005348 [Actinomortierella wolfii]
MKKSFGRSSGKDKKKAPAAVKEPQTWEEYMEEGVLLEEKGERYGTGEKARRYYEKAGDMYHKAHRLNPQDADILYNLGRILYILVDFTYSPCQKLSLLNASILRFRKALNYDPDNADSLFNLGQALTTHAELIQDHTEDEEHDHDHGDSTENSTRVLDNPEEQAAIELQEAIALFERCFTIQQRDLFEAVQAAHPTEESERVEKPPGLEEQEQRELSTQAGTLIDTLISTSQALTSLAFLVDDPTRAQDYYKQGIEKLEMALGVTGDRLLWPDEEDSDDQKKKGKGKEMDAVSSTLSLLGDDDLDGDVAPAVKPVSVFREAESSNETVTKAEKLCDIHLQYSNLLSSQSDRSYQDTGKINEVLYEESLKHLDIVLSIQPRHVEALCDKGDMLGSWAQGLVGYVIETDDKDEEDSEATAWDSSSSVALGEVPKREVATARSQASLSKRIWQLFALATRSFLSALEVEPQNTSILEKLGDIHWTRSRLGSAVAVKNRSQLLNNASVYYRYAWESCRDGAPNAAGSSEGVDEEQRLEILLSWAQVLNAMPGRQEDVIRVLKQWKRYGGSKQMLEDLLEGHASDILQEDFLEFALDLFRKAL